jgi:drug/metabolite transporter (DMT)-like permease
MKELKGYFMIMGAATFWGLSATAAKFLLNNNVSTVLIVQTRVTFSALLLLLFFLIFKRHLLRTTWRDAGGFLLLGVIGVAGSNITYYVAIRESTVATAIVLQYMAPLVVMAYGALSGEERLTGVKFAAGFLSLLGCLLVVGAFEAGAVRITPLGLTAGIGSIFTFSFLSIYTRKLLRRCNVWTLAAYSISGASLFWLVINPPGEVLQNSPALATWGGLFLFALISILIPHSLFFAGMQHVPASRAIITSTLEPVVAMASAAVFLAELQQPLQALGALLVLSAIVMVQLRREET